MVPPEDPRLEAADNVVFFHEGHELIAATQFDVKIAADVGERLDQLFRRVVAINASQRPIGADILPVRGGLENALDGVFEDATVFFLGSKESEFGASALDGVANGT